MDDPCTFYELASDSNRSIDKKRESIVSEFVGPSTISTLPNVLRSTKQRKKSSYSLDSLPEQVHATFYRNISKLQKSNPVLNHTLQFFLLKMLTI